ncbi:hypothetical protein A2U01_0060665 [Trifolium medium]|uniref:Uncharacterized protein n=1 Tax=Trifolium medium TaxID=97028 RepID=A0A392RTP6_9FABA|nr:hypothetical protein [Trifolium medium]
MNIGCCLVVTFFMMKLTIDGETLSRGWKLVEPLLLGLVSRGNF